MKNILIVVVIFFLLIILSSIIGDIIFTKKIKNEARKILETKKETDSKILIKEEIANLPKPVQKYLEYTQVIGKEKVKTVKLKQAGYFRVKKNQKWRPQEAEQYFNVDSGEFIWWAKVKFAPFFYIYAKDEFINNKGNLVVKLLGLIKIVDAKGYEVDHGEALRFLAECIWFPSAFLNEYFKWEAINNSSAKATITYKNISASAIFHFNEKGEVTKVTAKRYMEQNGHFTLENWEGQIIEYRMFNGVIIPNKVNIIWKLKDGDFCYDKLEITNIKYNVGLLKR